jgi:hypothetical protein
MLWMVVAGHLNLYIKRLTFISSLRRNYPRLHESVLFHNCSVVVFTHLWIATLALPSIGINGTEGIRVVVDE